MALPVSSLSLALQAFADFLDGQFGEEVVVSLDSPQKAAEVAKAGDKSVLNVFVFRLAPSGFHADATVQSPLFVRAHLLLTCFPPGQGDAGPDTDLRVIGHAMAVLHSVPVIPMVLPGPAPAGAEATDLRRRAPAPYRMQAVLQAPLMEELNHIWTTQGGELAYRLSAAYELALIPVEPLTQAPPPAPVRTLVLDVGVKAADDPANGPDGLARWGEAARAVPRRTEPLAPVTWAPVQLFPLAEGFGQSALLPPGTGAVAVALSGPLGAKVALTLHWTRADGTRQAQDPQPFTLAAQTIDAPEARVQVALADAAAGDRATLLAHAADAAGLPLAGAVPGNVLSLSVGGAP